MTFLTCTSPTDRFHLRNIWFPNTDVLTNKRSRIIRLANLLKAVTYESLSQCTTVIFADNDATCIKVSSKIIAVGDHLVHLENGVTMPLHRIVKIEFDISA